MTVLKRTLGFLLAGALVAPAVVALAWPPGQSGECLRPSGDCVFPVDRGAQVAILATVLILALMVAGAWATARRRRRRLAAAPG